MNKEQIALVKKTWQLFREVDPRLLGDVFFRKLFLEMPQAQRLFRFAREEQVSNLVDTLNIVVSRLDDLASLTDEIKQLAIRHKRYGVKEHHYKIIGHALLWTLQQGLGRDWNEEVRKAWSTGSQQLFDMIIRCSGYSVENTTG